MVCLLAYEQIARHAKIVHHLVNISAAQRVINSIFHIQDVNAYDSRLKKWMTKSFMACRLVISEDI